MKYARIIGNVAVDVRDTDPDGYYAPNVAAEFQEVPDSVENGWLLDGETWEAPVIPVIEPVEPTPEPLHLTPVEFKMCFTSTERVAITTIRDDDAHPASATLKDIYSILDDPRLSFVDLRLQSSLDLIDFLVTIGCLTPERAAMVKAGTII